MTIVLGIESSCDDSAAALYDSKRGLIAQQVYSQTCHQNYGGVVPELASRDHLKKITPVIKSLLHDANLSLKSVNALAYTKGPGLIGSLMVGAGVANALAFALDVPILGVNHLEAHLLAVFLQMPQPRFPFLTLLVSGGNTLLVHAKALGEYVVVGQTLDDAAGEAFDKVAKLLALSPTNGKAVSELATQGNPDRFNFPRPMLKHNNLDFSFSGLKTHVLGCYNKHDMDAQTKADIACAFEQAVVDVLCVKTKRAMQQLGLSQLAVVGGVSANQTLRARMQREVNSECFFPALQFCTDNAAMVAIAGVMHLDEATKDYCIDCQTRLPLGVRSSL